MFSYLHIVYVSIQMLEWLLLCSLAVIWLSFNKKNNKSAAEVTPVQARHKCLSRAHNAAKGALASTLLYAKIVLGGMTKNVYHGYFSK